MALPAGARLGPYEVVSPLGSGGMGEVYRGRDTRLDRSVAIKILPDEFAQNATLRLRFEREAKTISQLNHPNICTLYDVGENYLVMELLEGQTLAERIAKGPLPLSEVLTYGIQIAEALDKAHREGVVHRDLKPANVMITKTGAKLLDFGLAKSGTVVISTESATHLRELTQEGTILGTFQYMAPEQLEGIEADARTDIFALGAVLYEMVTGRRAFEGKTKTSLIAAIVSAQPTPVSQLQPVTPPALEHVIQRSLAKDPEDRWRSARDIAEELKWIQAKGSQAGVAAPVAARRHMRERLSWLLNAALVIAAAALTWGVIELKRESPRVIQTSIVPPHGVQFAFENAGAPAISPDGRRIAFAAVTAGGGVRQLYVRPLSGGSAQPLAGTEDATFPFWSPDSRMIGFFASGKLKKIDASGGPALTLADAQLPRGGSWSPSGVIVFAPTIAGPLLQVSDDGGIPTPVTTILTTSSDSSHRWPSFLPDGKRFLYCSVRAAVSADQNVSLWVGAIDGSTSRQLFTTGSNAVYSPDGYLVYERERSLVAQTFDPKTLEAGRQLVPIAEDVSRSPRGEAFFSISKNGMLVYQSGRGMALISQLIWYDAAGKAIGAIPKSGDYRGIRLSNDGQRLAAAIADPSSGRLDLWLADLKRSTWTRLTFDAADEFAPQWWPDDASLVYSADAKGPGDLMRKPSSGTGSEELLYESRMFKVAADVSPDGKLLIYQEQNQKSDWDLWIYSFEERKVRLFLQTPFSEAVPRFSPDGRWVTYHSNESGRFQIYVLPVSGTGGKWQISTDGGVRPRWSADQKTIYYLSLDDKIVAVDVRATGSGFTAGIPRVLFQAKIKSMPGNTFEVSADGKRFLINTPAEEIEIAPLTLVQNWTAAMKRSGNDRGAPAP